MPVYYLLRGKKSSSSPFHRVVGRLKYFAFICARENDFQISLAQPIQVQPFRSTRIHTNSWPFGEETEKLHTNYEYRPVSQDMQEF